MTLFPFEITLYSVKPRRGAARRASGNGSLSAFIVCFLSAFFASVFFLLKALTVTPRQNKAGLPLPVPILWQGLRVASWRYLRFGSVSCGISRFQCERPARRRHCPGLVTRTSLFGCCASAFASCASAAAVQASSPARFSPAVSAMQPPIPGKALTLRPKSVTLTGTQQGGQGVRTQMTAGE